jgi:zinc transporter 1
MHGPSKEHRIQAVIAISASFFILELVIGFRERSLALVADAFHVASDLLGFTVALMAIRKQRADASVPSRLTFGWQRAEVVGAFFNGVFLLALGVSILLQTIERFLSPVKIKDAKLVLIVGGVGLGLNALSALVLGGQSR